MRILAVSDIHDHVSAVAELRARERSDFDAVVVAGDIGSRVEVEVLDYLTQFRCPVAFVLGNHDHWPGEGGGSASPGHYIHLRPLQVGPWTLVGMDCPMTWWTEAPELVRQQLAARVREAGPERCIVVTHEQLTRTGADMGGVPLFLYGHRHRFECRRHRGTTYVNPGALGEVTTVRPVGGREGDVGSLRNAVSASYAVIELQTGGEVGVERRGFAHATEGWEPLQNDKWPTRPELATRYVSTT